MSKTKNLTTKIFIAMIAGILVGWFINAFLADVEFVQTYIVNGAFLVIGDMFIRALKMLVVPLVFFSLTSGVCNVGDITVIGRVGVRSLVFYLATTAAAITLGLIIAIVVGPGKGIVAEEVASKEFTPKDPVPLTEVLSNLIPSNPVAAFANGEMLQIIFFTVLFAICLLMVGDKTRKIVDGIDVLNDVMMNVVTVVMMFAPIGVFCLIAKTMSIEGFELIGKMVAYFSVVVICLLLHGFGTLALLFKTFTGLSLKMFYKKMRPAQLFAFSTASSNATIPVTLRSLEKRIGVDNATASFTVPLGATINMDGTSIMQGVATVFIANVYGVPLDFVDYITIVMMAVLASIGTAGVPGVGLIMLAMVLTQVGLPPEGIALIIGVDRLLDMMRTAVNVTGDAVVTTIVAKGEGKLDLDTFNNPDAGVIETVEYPHGHPAKDTT